MKYMHFRASCAYTALAAMMERKGVHTEDYEIALDMKLPWLFAKENGAYVSGPMLQGAKWFNLWLLPRGYEMREKSFDREELSRVLCGQEPVMLGIQTTYGKHAVVFSGYDGKYHFLNPTHEGSGESGGLCFTKEELAASVDQKTVVGKVLSAEPRPQGMTHVLYDSITAIRENCDDIESFAVVKHDPDAYFPMMNRLFRPLLLDGITMLELAGESGLAQEFAGLQQQLMAFMRGTRSEALGEMLSLDKLHELGEQYIRLIEGQIHP